MQQKVQQKSIVFDCIINLRFIQQRTQTIKVTLMYFYVSKHGISWAAPNTNS